ncbi:MAG TPA: hypothetical protein VIL20_00150 [Sandaracinaceae bacterium]
MSRAYVIRVSENLRRTVHVSDGVRSTLELLDVLPADRMEALLRAELAERGFAEEGELLVRVEPDGALVEIDPKARTVSVRKIHRAELELEHTARGTSARPDDAATKAALRERARERLERDAELRTRAMSAELAAELEKRLRDLRPELDRIAHRVIAAALKERAAQLGEVQEVSEDENAQSLTIRIKV